jgi:aspartyl-tRNA(Asn)/glutamyl-tRNA(Gln) amidotransferase subunit B
VRQETLGWDVANEVTFTQRVKEGEEDYRYFPEPDLPPLVLEQTWVDAIRQSLPELPAARLHRLEKQYSLNSYDAGVLVAEQTTADYFEMTAAAAPDVSPKLIANWISGELFALLNQAEVGIETNPISPAELAGLLRLVAANEINNTTAKAVLAEMFATQQPAESIIRVRGLRQVSDTTQISSWVRQVLKENPEQVATYLNGKETVSRWLFGQVMRLAQGQANPQVVQAELERQLAELK